MSYKGTIVDWSFDIINSNKAIIGDIYQCFGYRDGKTISTSPIRSVNVEKVNECENDKFVVVTTANGSKYILKHPNSIFTSYISNCLNDYPILKTNEYTFETLEGIKNTIEWYLAK